MGDIFLKFTGPDVKGESQDKDHTDWIEIDSFNWGLSNSAHTHTGSGASGGQAMFTDFVFSKLMDRSTATLMLKAADGTHFEKAEVVCYKAGGPSRVPYLTLNFEKVYISSYSTSGANGSGVSQESVTCSYAQVKQKYTEQSDTGEKGTETEFGWNVRENQSV